MKKRDLILYTFLLASTIWSCSVDEQIAKNENTIGQRIGNLNGVNLNIPELEMDWQYMYAGLGIRSEGVYPISIDTQGNQMLRYSCWIANKASVDYLGANDFVSKMSEDGIPSSVYYGYYDFQGILSITTFQNGLPIAQIEKQSFAVYPTDYKNGVNPQQLRTYGADTMYINAGSADLYLNRARVNQGKNLIVVEINPDLQIFETDYTDNVSTLPVNVQGAQGVLDLSVIDENKTIPPSNIYFERTRVKGKTKVFLNWDCPYHEPFYVKHWFTVKRNGQIVYDGEDVSEFTDLFNGNPQITIYTITTTVKAIGESIPVTLTVTR